MGAVSEMMDDDQRDDGRTGGLPETEREGGRKRGRGRGNFSRLEVGSQPKSIQSKDGSDLKGAGAVRASKEFAGV